MGARRLNFGGTEDESWGTENESWRTEDESRGTRDASRIQGMLDMIPQPAIVKAVGTCMIVYMSPGRITLGSAGLRHKPEPIEKTIVSFGGPEFSEKCMLFLKKVIG